MFSLIWNSFKDLYNGYFYSKDKKYEYAFLVHPRNISDVYRKYSFVRFLPEWIISFGLLFYWPVIITKVTGLKSKDGKDIMGLIITIPLLTEQMLKFRKLAIRKIVRAGKLAENKGVKIIGLGVLTSSVTKGGLDLKGKLNVNITTGHAYTAYNVTKNLFKLAEIFNADKKQIKVAIVGAAGSVGSSSAKLIARSGFNNILLVDLPRKIHLVKKLVSEIKELNRDIVVEISGDINDINTSDFIITATNAPEAMVLNTHLKSGAVVIDDAQPSDVHPDVLKREDVLVVEAGVVNTPNIFSHFNFNLKNRDDNFCCMAEVLILASYRWSGDYVIHRTSLELIDKIVLMSQHLNFRVGDFQNFLEKITPEKINKIKEYYV